MSLNKNKDVPALTGLRGLAALIVVLYHYLEAPTAASGHMSSPFSGYLGVELFFILSGYLMALNYGSAFERTPYSVRTYIGFLGKRFARVYPLYAVASLLVFAAWLIVLYPNHLRFRNLMVNLALVQQLGPGLIDPGLGDSILGGAWSISTEIGAYILFPLLYAVSCRGGNRLAWTAATTAIAALVVLAVLPDHLKPQQLPSQGPLDVWSGWNLWPLVRCLSEFSIGLLIFRLTRTTQLNVLHTDAASLLVSTALIVSLFIPGLDLLSVFLIACLVAHTSQSASRVTEFLSSKLMIWLGEVSYSIYILHFSVITAVYERPLPFFKAAWFHDRYWLVFVVALATLFIVSRFAFDYIERPGRRMLRNLFHAPKRPMWQDPSIP